MFLFGKWKNLPPPSQNNACNGIYPSVNPNQYDSSKTFNNNNEETAEGFTMIGSSQNPAMHNGSNHNTAVFRPNNQWSAMTLERQKSEILTTGIDGISFQLHPKYMNCSTPGTGSDSVFVLPQFEIKTAQQIAAESQYSVDLEMSLIHA